MKLSKKMQDTLNLIYDYGTTETAILFIKRAYDLLNDNGNHSFIIPKSYTYASNYSRIRKETLSKMNILVDCGKVWQDVKLEVCIFCLSKNKNLESYSSLKLLDQDIYKLCDISKNLCTEFDFFLNGLSEKEISLGKRVKDNSISLNEIVNNQRGGMLQKYVHPQGDTVVLGGAELKRYTVKNIPKGYIDKTVIDNDKCFIGTNTVLVQNIVAHVQNPSDHIKIICALPGKQQNMIILDTINQLTPCGRVSNKYIVALLNSKFINWYTYLFVFGKAIRTMHFDNATTAKILFPQNVSVDSISKIEVFIDQILSAKKANPNADTRELESHIDRLVYKLYNLTEAEIGIIEEEETNG